jgi:flagellar biosynthetic protein FlhB
VAKATVVVTNPTHYAVALSYERGGGGAPKVVAKGMDEMAARIREAAREAGVPVVPNPPLARALHALKVDAEIPAEHFQAVAALIAWVWRLRGQAGPRR